MKGVNFGRGKVLAALKQRFGACGSPTSALTCHTSELSHNSPMAVKISFTWWLDFADVSMNRRSLVLANSSPS